MSSPPDGFQGTVGAQLWTCSLSGAPSVSGGGCRCWGRATEGRRSAFGVGARTERPNFCAGARWAARERDRGPCRAHGASGCLPLPNPLLHTGAASLGAGRVSCQDTPCRIPLFWCLVTRSGGSGPSLALSTERQVLSTAESSYLFHLC